MAEYLTIEQAREIVACWADKDGYRAFAREVRAGSWDHRKDVQTALKGKFDPEKRGTKRGR